MPFTPSQLETLKKAYSSGVLKVRFGDHEVTYKSEEELRRTIEKIEREINDSPRVHVKSLRYAKGV